jgi:hypothetical protein
VDASRSRASGGCKLGGKVNECRRHDLSGREYIRGSSGQQKGQMCWEVAGVDTSKSRTSGGRMHEAWPEWTRINQRFKWAAKTTDVPGGGLSGHE